MNYKEKFKDPRWQKKRLEILNRDNFTCKSCGDTEDTLHVHHFYYIKDKDPWDYPDKAYITLCDTCHFEEHEYRYEVEKELLLWLKKKRYLVQDVSDLALYIFEQKSLRLGDKINV